LTIKGRPGVNLEFCGLSVTLEMPSGHYFKATDYVNTADQLPLQLEITRGNPRFHVSVGAND
jgi:hypothetical protein